MTSHKFRRLLLALSSGAVFMQVPGCTETAAVVTAVATTVSAGGLLFLINRILD